LESQVTETIAIAHIFLFGKESELVTNCDRFKTLKHSSVSPWAFTEHGALMVANVLNSPKAIKMSVALVETFVHALPFLKTMRVYF
jgi:hypothetical protein